MQFYLTGAQSVGKTTLVRQLRSLPQLSGLQVIEEVARDLIRAEGTDLAIFQDYKSHEEEFYQFNLKLVRRYLEMAQRDKDESGSCSSSGDQLKLYDRSGIDAISYIATYLPHMEDRMLGEQCVQELMMEYAAAGSRITMVVLHPQQDFIVHDGVRLPPRLAELLSYTDKLCAILQRWRIAWVDVTARSLRARTQQMLQLMTAAREISGLQQF